MNEGDEIRRLIVRLFSAGALPRGDALVLRAQTEEGFRQELDRRLSSCGFVLLDNPYADHVGLGVERELAREVFGREDHWLSNTFHLNSDEVTILVILWALLIIPKRMRQQGLDDDTQGKAFAAVLSRARRAPMSVSLTVLIEDFKNRWKPSYLKARLAVLARHGFIQRDRNFVLEGPKLDVLFDYKVMVSRVLEGVLGDFSQLLDRNRDAVRREEVLASENLGSGTDDV